MDVVTLLPSATEIVCALGGQPVGVSHECDHPPPVADLPAVTRSRVGGDGSSGEINEAVAAAEDGDGVYAVDRERLAALDPDLVVTQGVCDVCAVDQVLVREAVADLGLDAEVLTMDVHSLDDLFETIGRIGAAMERPEAATDLRAALRSRVETVTERAPGDGPRVAVLDWMDPVMVAGHWVPELVALAGGRYEMEDPGAHSRPREWAALRQYDPEALVVAPCGFDLDQTRTHLAELTERPGWADLTAVEEGRVVLVDGHHYVNRPGPRLIETLEFLAWAIHPDAFERPPSDAVAPLPQSAP